MDNLSLHTFQKAQLANGQLQESQIAEKAKTITHFKDLLANEKSRADEQKTLARQAAEAKAKAELARFEGQDDIDPRIKKAAQEFEAVFMAEMIKPIFEKLEVNQMFGGGHAESMYRSMIVQEYGQSIAENGGIGLQDYLINQIQEYQKGAQK